MLRTPNLGLEAVLEFSDSDFRIVKQGNFVRCAVTSQPIPLDDLRYWSAERQEAYSSPVAVIERLKRESERR